MGCVVDAPFSGEGVCLGPDDASGAATHVVDIVAVFRGDRPVEHRREASAVKVEDARLRDGRGTRGRDEAACIGVSAGPHERVVGKLEFGYEAHAIGCVGFRAVG